MPAVTRILCVAALASCFAVSDPVDASAQYVVQSAPAVVGYTAERRGLFGRRVVYRPIVAPVAAAVPVATAPVAVARPVVTVARPVLAAPVTVARPVLTAPVTVARPVVTAPVTTYYAPVAPVTTYRVPVTPVLPVMGF